ncbi:MAG TPA: hypothetical protein VG328_00130 [Stellaceae bacterium]|nr:hypothetical protein [Stellaceae bacterium]
MSGKFDDPDHWVALAAQTRATAEFVRDVFAKRELLLIAQRYELLATRAARKVGHGTEDKQQSA